MPAPPPAYPAAQALRVVLKQPQARRAGVGLAAALGASAASASWTPAALCSPASVAIAAEVSSGKPYIKKPTVFDPFGPVVRRPAPALRARAASPPAHARARARRAWGRPRCSPCFCRCSRTSTRRCGGSRTQTLPAAWKG